jgi:hypothetical protein
LPPVGVVRVDARDRHPEDERAEEVPLVELDRLCDDLPDRSSDGRERWRKRAAGA